MILQYILILSCNGSYKSKITELQIIKSCYRSRYLSLNLRHIIYCLIVGWQSCLIYVTPYISLLYFFNIFMLLLKHRSPRSGLLKIKMKNRRKQLNIIIIIILHSHLRHKPCAPTKSKIQIKILYIILNIILSKKLSRDISISAFVFYLLYSYSYVYSYGLYTVTLRFILI